ncbi:hypothetical protein [Nostoc phage NMeng1]|nr:hypothetical protein [Nostoc phage NMeng1]
MPAVFTGDNTGATNVAASLQSFINANRAVLLPAGIFRVDSTITIPNGHSVTGEGKELTTVRGGTQVGAVIEFNPSYNIANTFQIRDMHITRASAGFGQGLRIAQYSMRAVISNVRLSNHTIGLVLGSTDYGQVDGVEVVSCTSHGIYMTNTVSGTAFNAVQWYLNAILSQLNGGSGMVVESTDFGAGNRPPFGIALGDWTGFRTFKNSGYGLAVLGKSAVPINGVRMRNAFIGEDWVGGAFFDTYGRLHMIANGFFEIAGRWNGGALNNTNADNLHFTANNEDATIYTSFFNGAGRDNISLNQSASHAKIIQGCTSMNALRHGLLMPSAGRGVVHGLLSVANASGNSITGTPAVNAESVNL